MVKHGQSRWWTFRTWCLVRYMASEFFGAATCLRRMDPPPVGELQEIGEVDSMPQNLKVLGALKL